MESKEQRMFVAPRGGILRSEVGRSSPNLLNIPAELRNNIYELVLLSKDDINIGIGWKQPGLLSVCRQVCDEASPIYYTSNAFFYQACRTDGASTAPFMKLLAKYRKDGRIPIPVRFCIHHTYYNSDNLEAWLKAYHADSLSVASPAQDMTADLRDSVNLVVRMFGVCKAMENKPWNVVEAVLRSFYDAVLLLEELWVNMMAPGVGGEEMSFESSDAESSDGDDDESMSDEDDGEEDKRGDINGSDESMSDGDDESDDHPDPGYNTCGCGD